MTKCPNCFIPVPLAHSAWMCASGSSGSDGDRGQPRGGAQESHPEVITVQHPPSGRRARIPAPPSCKRCSGECAEVCPTCDYRFPAGWRGSSTTCIAMAGARATGKSIYIAVLIKQLQQLGECTGTTVLAANDHTLRTFAEMYERPLYEQRGIMMSTPPVAQADSYQREPLIFALRSRTGSQSFLVIRDVAGEDLEARDVSIGRLRFFRQADGVFFLFDPLRVQEISDLLQDLVPAQRTGGDPTIVLENTLHLMGNAATNLAVVLSKFDALQALRDVDGAEWSLVMQNPGAAFVRDPGPVAPYDEDDGDLLHEEVRSLLQRLRSGSLVGRVESASATSGLRHRFFAVSALGEPPSGAVLNPRGIAPFRCLDPLKWVMAQTNRS